jgi:hypothetical protein
MAAMFSDYGSRLIARLATRLPDTWLSRAADACLQAFWWFESLLPDAPRSDDHREQFVARVNARIDAYHQGEALIAAAAERDRLSANHTDHHNGMG